MKSSGKRSGLRLTCSFRRFVGTPYNSAGSASSMTFWPRTSRIRWVIISGAVVQITDASSSKSHGKNVDGTSNPDGHRKKAVVI
jgi:hypothetical protein